MPSDAKKKQQQKKKEAAKARQSGKKPQSNNQTKAAEDGKEQSPTSELQNGTNGSAISTEGIYVDRLSVPLFLPCQTCVCVCVFSRTFFHHFNLIRGFEKFKGLQCCFLVFFF